MTDTSTSLPVPPLVSIGMPVYNGERFIREALDSILAQTFADFELIVSDNASTDGTPNICAEYAARDRRVRYYRNERNLGATYNYNRVFALARGKYFRHAAHDDVLAPTNIERCVEVLQSDPDVVLCYPRMRRIDHSGKIIDSWQDTLHLRETDPVARYRRYHELTWEGSMNDPIFGLFRSDVLRKTPLIQSFSAQDMVLLGEIALLGQIHEVPDFLFFERWYPGTSMNANRTPDDLAAWFDPRKRGDPSNYVPHWVWLREYLRAIGRTQLGPLTRMRCALVLLPWSWRSKRGLVLGPIAAAAASVGLHAAALRLNQLYFLKA